MPEDHAQQEKFQRKIQTGKTIVWETLCYPGKFSTDRDARVQDHPPAEAHRHVIPPHQN